MRTPDFDIYKDLLRERSGLFLTPDKSALLEARLSPVARKWGFESLEAMTAALKENPDPHLIIRIVEAMATPDSSFFRDGRPFDYFRETILPRLMDSRKKERALNIWCAAAASGQEPYSLALILKELEEGPLAGWEIRILATDISTETLQQAGQGVYSQFEMQRGLPIRFLLNHFTQEGEKWRLHDDIRRMVEYRYFNLLDSMTDMGKFDAVFCRNVLTLFEDTRKKDVLERLALQIEPGGFLALGTSENADTLPGLFTPCPGQPGLYIRS
ncbi:MAG: protein-glutamate O-methyltransferase CheR [Alphaproteobacteria bacterium]|nr:protein-glutamate O-methyltransferase CheR [Alphaproteobacteria bacterium]